VFLCVTFQFAFAHLMNRLALYFCLLFCLQNSLVSNAQNCSSNVDTSFSCLQQCADLSAIIPDVRQTTDYQVTSIPYCPYDFETNAPLLTSACTSKDDKYLDTSYLPFPFCFYGSIYNKYVIGTNALITFDSTMALRANAYAITGNPVPFAGGTAPVAGNCPVATSSVYYPRAAIFGAFHDIIPRVNEPYKIEARTEGIAPNRRHIISFSNISQFGCSTQRATSQIVLYEGTGVIDVYIKDKPTCTNSNGNRAIVGIQNWERNKGVGAPGRNAEPFTATNEAWRFTPSGGLSAFISATLYKNGVPVATGDTVGIGNGRLRVTFPNVCDPSSTASYTMKVLYDPCPSGTAPSEYTGTINVTRTAGSITASVANASCGSTTGTITVTNPTGPTYEYSINGTTWQASNVFTVVPGTYTVRVRLVGTQCTSTQSVTVGTAPTFSVGTSVNASACNANTGSITVITTGGTAPFTYSLDGVTYQTSNVFSNLAPGTYTIRTKDATGCVVTVTDQVGTNSGPTATATVTNATCNASNGSITVSVTAGTAPFTFALNSGAYQTSNQFSNLAPGTYTISVRDGNNCVFTFTQTISSSGGATATATTTSATCSTATNGTITVAATGGATPYNYSIGTGGSFQSSNTFTNLAPGVYQITVRDAANCDFILSITVSAGSGITATANVANASCTNASDGSITVNASNGAAPYTYSLNGGVFQSSNTFNSLAAGTYTIQVRDTAGCTFSLSQVVGANGGATATATSINASCGAANDGTITVNATGGTTPYSYSLNGGAFQSSNIFSGLAAGSYTIRVRDASNCVFTFTHTIATNGGPGATATSINASCATATNGSITVNASAGQAPYSYAINGGAFQSSNVFGGVAPGSHSIQVRDASNCLFSFTHTVGADAGVTATTSTTPATCATANNGSVTITPSGGASPFSYSVDSGPAQTSNVFSNLSVGNHNYQVLDAANCSFTGTFTITAGAGITATATTTNAACGGSASGSIVVTASGGSSPYQYSINGGAFQASNTFSNLAAGTYTIGVRDASGCSTTISATIGNNPSVTATAIITPAGCPGSSTGRITINASAGSAPFNFQLNGGASQTSNVFSNLAAGSYAIRVTDAGGCIYDTTVNVGSLAAIDAQLTVVHPSCNGNFNGSIIVNPVNGTSPFEYSLNGGTFQSSNGFFNLTGGTYTIRIRDNVGCTKDTSVVLNEPSTLNATATTTQASCSGNPDGSVIITATGGTGTYEYSIDNGTTYKTNNTIPAGVGSYQVVVKDNQGCTATTTATVTLNDTMRLELGPDTTVCFAQPYVLQPNTNAATNGFVWTPAAGLDNPSARNPKATPADTTKYYLTATWGLCTRTDSITLNVKRQPIANAGTDTTICDRGVATLNGSASNLTGSVTYSWSPSSQVSSANAQITTARPTRAGRNTYVLTVSDNTGCNFHVRDEVVVTMKPPVPAKAGNDTIAALGQAHQLFGSGGISYLWSPAAPLNNAATQNPVATLFNDTRFILTVTDDAGCLGYDTVNIKVYRGPAYYVPSAFTPNGDGLNDVFRGIHPGIERTEFFRIFNRYGKLVFQTNQPMRGWDGTFQGKPQENGVYVWIIKGFDKVGKVVEQRGTVTLLR
jgi:gliding motility-associated-like protein